MCVFTIVDNSVDYRWCIVGGCCWVSECINNPKKCRARFGIEQQHQWCKPCKYVRSLSRVCAHCSC